MKMPLDRLRFRLEPGEAYQEVVGVADIPEPPGVPGTAVLLSHYLSPMPYRRPLVTLTAEFLDEAVDFFHRHPVGGFFGDALGGRSGSFVDSAVRTEKQVGVVEVPVYFLVG